MGPLPGQQIEQNCYSSYSNCVSQNASENCEVMYNQQFFTVPSSIPCSSDKYIFSGAVTLQACTDIEITRLHANNVNLPMPVISTRMMPRRIERTEPSNTNFNVKLFFLMIGCGGFTTVCVVWLISVEKELKLKQLLHMIGVAPSAYWFGWFIGYVAVWAFVGVILWGMLLFFKSSELQSSNGCMLLLVIWLAGINAIVMAFLIVSLSSRVVVAITFAVAYIFAIGLVYVILSVFGAGEGTCLSNSTYWVSKA